MFFYHFSGDEKNAEFKDSVNKNLIKDVELPISARVFCEICHELVLRDDYCCNHSCCLSCEIFYDWF